MDSAADTHFHFSSDRGGERRRNREPRMRKNRQQTISAPHRTAFDRQTVLLNNNRRQRTFMICDWRLHKSACRRRAHLHLDDVDRLLLVRRAPRRDAEAPGVRAHFHRLGLVDGLLGLELLHLPANRAGAIQIALGPRLASRHKQRAHERRSPHAPVHNSLRNSLRFVWRIQIYSPLFASTRKLRERNANVLIC